MILTLASVLVPPNIPGTPVTKHQLLWDCVAEVERYRLRDLEFPSYHNMITVSCLEFLKRLQMVGLVSPVDLNLYVSYSKVGNFSDVRLSAIEALEFFGCDMDPILMYFLDIVESDPDLAVRTAVVGSLIRIVNSSEINFRERFYLGNEKIRERIDRLFT